tara:strand:- start:326 stop:457 length:132 start_codon:yes stop_codon:yes gene_type:complete
MKIPYKIKLVKMLIKDKRYQDIFDITEGDDSSGTKCLTIWWKG